MLQWSHRVNSNLFNVPTVDTKIPMILDKENLLNVSTVLSKVNIMNGDFSIISHLVDDKTFVYFDPPIDL